MKTLAPAKPKTPKKMIDHNDPDIVAQARAAGTYNVRGKEYSYDAMMAELAKAHKGDTAAWAIVKEILGEASLIEAVENPDAQARNALLDTVLGSDLPVKASYKAQSEALQRKLEGPNASELERLMCQRVATCWLDTNLADASFYSQTKKLDSVSFGLLRFHEYRRERANARYLAAVTTLARVRRLLAPVMQQVNIATPGAQQVNIAQAAPSTPVSSHSVTTSEPIPEKSGGDSGVSSQ